MIGTKNDRKTARDYTTEDFRRLRKAMGWKWEDINALTGLSVARTNMTKGLPAWANLALEIQRRVEQGLRLGVVDAVVQRLGSDWVGTPTLTGGVLFKNRKQNIELSFAPGSFTVRGRGLRAEGLIDQLEMVYGNSSRKLRPIQGTFNLMREGGNWGERLDAVLNGEAIF